MSTRPGGDLDVLRQSLAALDERASRFHVFAELFQSAPEACLVTDRDTRILLFNQAASALFRVPSRRFGAKFLLAFLPLARRPAFRAQLAERTGDWLEMLQPRGGDAFPAKISLRRAAGELHWRIRAVPA